MTPSLVDQVNDQLFERMISQAIDAIPDQFAMAMDNVAIVYADAPTLQQRIKLHLRPNSLLFGLYEGIPKTKRWGSPTQLPDKITIFKYPIVAVSQTVEDVAEKVKRTVWHEIAHHFGLNEHEVRTKEAKKYK